MFRRCLRQEALASIATEYAGFNGNRIAVSEFDQEDSSYEVFLGPDLIPFSHGYILMRSVVVHHDSLEGYASQYEELLRLAAAVAVLFHRKGCGPLTPEEMVHHYWNTWRNEILFQQGEALQKRSRQLANSLQKVFGFHANDVAILSRL